MALALIAQHWNDFGFADRLSLSLRAEGRASCLRKAQFHSPASSPVSGRSLLFASTPMAISPRGTMRNKHSRRHKISLSTKSPFPASMRVLCRMGEMKHGALGQGSSFFPIFCTRVPSIPAASLLHSDRGVLMGTKWQWLAPRCRSRVGTGVCVQLPLGWWHGRVCPPGQHQRRLGSILCFEAVLWCTGCRAPAPRLPGASSALGELFWSTRPVLLGAPQLPTAVPGDHPQPCCGKERLVEALVGTRICPHSHPSPGAEGHRAAHPGGVSARAPTPPLCASHSPEPPAAPFPLLPGELSPSQGAPLVLGLLRGVPTGLCRDPCARCAPLSFSPPQHPGTAEQLPDTASREG